MQRQLLELFFNHFISSKTKIQFNIFKYKKNFVLRTVSSLRDVVIYCNYNL